MDELDKDTKALADLLPGLSAEAGKFALVAEAKLVGVFPTYQAALEKGYEVAGLKPFLVERISQIPQVQQYTRVIGFECLTSP